MKVGKSITICLLLLGLSIQAFGQNDIDRQYEPSDAYPYGRPNPEYAEGLKAFAPMIGRCQCKSLRRNPDRTWADTTDLLWEYKYILNGTAIQDVSWTKDRVYSGSVRQYNADSAQWFVTNFTTRNITANPKTWKGGIDEKNDIVLYNEQKATNGLDGYYKITFKDIKEDRFNWSGEWVNKSGTVSFPTWYLWCEKLEP